MRCSYPNGGIHRIVTLELALSAKKRNMSSFPRYLKYPHERTFFKVTSETTFTQLDIIGTAYHLHEFTASVYPDRVLIQDMLQRKDGYWVDSSEEEYLQKVRYCKEHLTAL